MAPRSKSESIRKHLTYANLMSTFAVFAVLGGGAYAAVQLKKNTVKSKQIKDGQVKGVDIGDNQVKGVDVGDESLGGQDVADGSLKGLDISDESLGGQDVADGSLQGQDIADQSVGAADLNPALVASLKPVCPGGMTRFGNTLCIETGLRAADTYYSAASTCANANLRLPTLGEAWMARGFVQNQGDQFWTDAVWREGGNIGVDVAATLQWPPFFRAQGLGATVPFRCATIPSSG